METLRRQTDVALRRQDKEAAWSDPFDDLFDRFVEADQFQLADSAVGPGSSDDLINFFDAPAPSSVADPFDTSPVPAWDGLTNDDSTAAWDVPPPCAQQSPASSSLRGNEAVIYRASHGRAAFSDPELFSLEAPTSTQAHPIANNSSTPNSPTPAPRSTRRGLASALTKALSRTRPTSVQKPVQKHGTPPRMMRSSTYKLGFQDIWQKRMEAAGEKLNIRLSSHNGPDSPPPSAELLQFENGNGFGHPEGNGLCFSSALHHRDEEISPLSTHFPNAVQLNMTPLASPVTEQSSNRSSFFQHDSSFSADRDDYLTSPLPTEVAGFLETPPPSHRLPSASWAPDSLDFSLSASSPAELANTRPQSWSPWTHASASQPCAASSYSATHQPDSGRSYPAVLSLDDQNGLHDLSRHVSGDLATAGLMIQCEPSTSSASLQHPSDSLFSASPTLYSNAFDTPSNEHQMSPPLGSFSSQPQYTMTPNLNLGSPTVPAPRTRGSHSRSRSAHHRRKSSGTGGGSLNGHYTPYGQNQHYHTRSAGSTSATGNGSQSTAAPKSAGATPSVGFVNFTPHDSRKILGGVAPSGSSKTKARREKEEQAKRRKLSQAATRAILEAGGDLTKLEREGLLAEF